jgi:predicted O-linked N-acetylglucosamine transferase (SPINDLY family)
MKPNRNAPCPCGSGKKYKHCCERKEIVRPSVIQPSLNELNRLIERFNAGHLAEVEAQARLLIEKFPKLTVAWKLLGVCLHRQGRREDALPVLSKAANLAPNDAEAHYNLGVTQESLKQYSDAAASYRRSLEMNPIAANTHNNLANVLRYLGQLDVAETHCQAALKINPQFAGALNNLGSILSELGRSDEAITSLSRSIKIDPMLAEAHSNLGGELQNRGDFENAEKSYRKALLCRPDFAEAQTNLLCLLNCTSYTAQNYLMEALKFGQMVSKNATNKFSSWSNTEQPKRLRVGMVSGKFRNHPVGFFLEAVLANINQESLELIAYSTFHKEDSLTARIRPYFSAWKSIAEKSDDAVASMIHKDGINLLIDLSGHSEHNRLGVFAWKPAPVQLSWLDSFATTGVTEMDYLVADETGVSDSQRADFSEAIWYLPDTRMCFSPPHTELPISSLPALKNDGVTFGCFQRLDKMNAEMLATWGQIFSAIPNAKLRWQCKQFGNPIVAEQVMQRLQQNGISANRISLQGAVLREAYLLAHAEVDMLLDTFPYPGGTTTCEAMWMGVPTLTLQGHTMLSRQGASLLSAAGLQDWIATSYEDYIAKAIYLASDLPKLAVLRAGLRDQVSISPLFDAPRFARNFEQALWAMWQEKMTRSF